MAKWIKVTLVFVVLGFALGTFWELRKGNAQTLEKLARERAHREQAIRVRAESTRLREFVTQATVDESEALRAVHREVEKARAEVRELERSAEERFVAKRAKDQAAAEKLASNRDLTKGPVLVENCVNAGRATPSDTLQTLVWAGVKGEDDLVASLLALDPKARALVAALLATLPQSAREKYPTPEKLAALLFADLVTNLSAVQVVRQTPLDGQRVVLAVGGLSNKTVDLVMELGPNGWSAVTADRKLFDQFKAKLTASDAAPSTASAGRGR